MRRVDDEFPEPVDAAAVWAAVSRNDVEFLRSAIVWISLNAEDYEPARLLCAALSSHDDEFVRGNAVLGFGHLARIFGVVHPDDVEIVKVALRDLSGHVRGHAHSAVDDIRMFVGSIAIADCESEDGGQSSDDGGGVEFERGDLTSGVWLDWSTNEEIRAVFVGWLGRDWSGTGCRDARARDALVAALFAKVSPASERNIVRGITPCPVCGQTVYVTRSGQLYGAVSDEEDRLARHAAAAHEAWNVLFHSELWVLIRPGEYYVSPMLIIHFINAHGYTPPDGYLEAVLGSKTVRFEVRAVFQFSGDVTAIVGIAHGAPPRIGGVEATVLLDGRAVGVLRLSGERMPAPATNERGERVVEVVGSVDWDAERVRAGGYQLCWNDSEQGSG